MLLLLLLHIYLSIFSTPIFNYISLSILNILFISLCSLFSLAVPFGPSIHTLPCCTFASINCTATSQFYYSLFLPILYPGHKIPLLSCSHNHISSSTLYIFYPCHFSSSCFSFSLVSYFLTQATPHVSYLFFKEESLFLILVDLYPLAFVSSTIHIYCHYFPCYSSCYQGTVNVLSGYPRWIFRKNSMEFFIGLQPYLYYYYSGCTLEFHDHMSFPECSMVT